MASNLIIVRPGGKDNFVVTKNKNFDSVKIQLEWLVNNARDEFRRNSQVGRLTVELDPIENQEDCVLYGMDDTAQQLQDQLAQDDIELYTTAREEEDVRPRWSQQRPTTSDQFERQDELVNRHLAQLRSENF